jgi:K+-sensing histidine kinase KdpD
VRGSRGATSLVVVAALLGPLALAVALVPSRGSLSASAAALSFVALIAAVAIGGNRLLGVVATVLSVLCFDVLLTVPYGRLTISRRPDLETAIALAVVGLVVTEMAAWARRHRRAADEEQVQLDLVGELAELAATGAAPAIIVSRTSAALVRLLELRTCSFEPGDLAHPPARLEPDGSIVHVGLRWPVEAIGIPGPRAEIVARWRGELVGRFVLVPTPGTPVSLARRRGAVVLVELAAGALAGQRVA